MSQQVLKQLVQGYFAVINGESDKPITDFLSPDIVWHLPPGHPFGTPFTGMDSVLEMMGRGIGLYEPGSIKVRVQCLIAEAENIAAQFELTGRLTNGDEYLNHYMFRFRFENGQIAEAWEYLDTLYASQKDMF